MTEREASDRVARAPAVVALAAMITPLLGFVAIAIASSQIVALAPWSLIWIVLYPIAIGALAAAPLGFALGAQAYWLVNGDGALLRRVTSVARWLFAIPSTIAAFALFLEFLDVPRGSEIPIVLSGFALSLFGPVLLLLWYEGRLDDLLAQRRAGRAARTRREWTETAREIAASLGITASGDEIRGVLPGGRAVRISLTLDDRIRVTIGGLHAGFLLIPVRSHESNQSTGDPVFDLRFSVEGPPLDRVAALALKARRQLQRLADRVDSLRIENGELFVEIASGDARTIDLLARDAIDVAGSLPGPLADVRAAAAETLRDDPLPEVRLRALVALLASSEPAEREALARAALSDPGPEVRLSAALHLDEKDPDALATIRAIAVADLPPRIRGNAMMLAEKRLDSEERAKLFLALLSDKWSEIRASALDAIAKHRIGGAAHRLEPLSRDESAEVRGRAIRAALKLRATSAEEWIIRLVGDRDSRVARAAVEALGYLGSTLAVEPLLAYAARVDSYAEKAARWSITQIQDRVRGGGRGQLTLSEAPEGTDFLSEMPEGEPDGALSELAPEAGALEVADSPPTTPQSAGRRRETC